MTEADKMASKSDDKLSLSLRWGSHRETVLQSLESSYGDQDFVDMTLACEGQSIKAHKVVVSACSSHLKQLLKENPSPHPIIILKDVAMTELRRLLEFMYCGRVTVEQQQLESLLEAAKMLGIRALASAESLEELEGENLNSTSTLESDNSIRQRLKRNRSESPTLSKRPRPVPPLQSILAQTLLTSSTSTRQGQGESSSEMTAGSPARSSSPPNTLAKLLAQSPTSTFGSCHSLEAETNNLESNFLKVDNNSCTSNQVDVGLQLKQEAVDLDLGMDNPTEALELEYQNPDFDDTIDTDSYQQQIGLTSSVGFESVHERIGNATAFMLSLAQRANQNNPFVSPPLERKLSFHEPRPCPVCNKMYRDAAILRTHMATMHPTARLNTTDLARVVSAGESSRSAPLSAAEYLASMAENRKSDSQWRRWQ